MQIPGYRIIRRINHGGMSTVYLAVQLSVGREVALKIMSPALTTDPVFGRRFQREANIVGQLSHPNIVSIYDIGCHNNLNYIAMDYLPGGTVHERMRSGMGTADVLKVIRKIALALDHVHSKGYVHADIKPENILFREDGTAVLTDFGVAKTLTTAARGNDGGTIVGTPHYMSPEQSRGQPIDGRSDLYSLGVVFYEMLVGAVPYRGEDAVAIAIKHLTAEIPTLPPQYAVYQHLINRLLAKEPDSRFQTGAELVTAVDIVEETLAGFPSRRTLTTDPTELNTGALFKALLRTSFAALAFKLRQLSAALPGRRAASASAGAGDDDWLDQVDTLEEKRPTILSARVQDALHYSSSKRRHAVRRTALLTALLVVIVAVLILDGRVRHLALPEVEATPGMTAIDPAIATPPVPKSTVPDDPVEPEVVKAMHTITVHPQPADARVRILNIRERYRPGISLEKGRYHIEVSRPGYTTLRKWVELEDDNLVLSYAITPLHKPGDVFTDALTMGGTGPEMVVIPAGDFVMGKDGVESASPQRTVTIERSFAISKHEITFELYDLYAAASDRPTPNDRRRGAHPVVNVSWHDASEFARWLSEQTGQQYRLATEAEWEYVARAGSSDDYWWGSDTPGDRANCRRGCESEYAGIFSSRAAPVGSFPPNPFGIHDTAGNVAEWVLDCYQDGYLGASADGRATITKGCSLRSVRGGSASDDHRALYSFSRKGMKPEQRASMVGFRLVREFDYH